MKFYKQRHQLIDSRQRIFPTGKRRIIYSKHPLLAYITYSIIHTSLLVCCKYQKVLTLWHKISNQISNPLVTITAVSLHNKPHNGIILHTEIQLQKHLPLICTS